MLYYDYALFVLSTASATPRYVSVWCCPVCPGLAVFQTVMCVLNSGHWELSTSQPITTE